MALAARMDDAVANPPFPTCSGWRGTTATRVPKPTSIAPATVLSAARGLEILEILETRGSRRRRAHARVPLE